MARATIDDFGRAANYFELLEQNTVTHVALLWVINGNQFFGAIYKREQVLDHLIRTESDKLLQSHDGTRLKPLQTRTDGKARNAAMLALWDDAPVDMIFRVPTKQGGAVFEKAIAEAIGGKWTGGEKNHRWDVEKDDMRIECKGQQGLMQPDECHK